MGETLSKEDMKLLSEMQKNSKISYKELSNLTGLPASTIHDHVKRFTESGLIKGYITVLNEELLGYNYTAIIGVETGALLYKKVANSLSQIHEVLEVYGTTAEFDLIIKVRTNSRVHLSEVLNLVRNIEGVNDINIASVLETFKEEHYLPLSSYPHK